MKGSQISEDDPDIRNYESWPSSLEAHEVNAVEVLGMHFVSKYDNWINLANRMLFRGECFKSPDERQKQYLDWISTLDDAGKKAALDFVKEIVSGTVFSFLAAIDGSAGYVLRGDYRESIRLRLEIMRLEDIYQDKRDPVESIEINPDSTQQLHDRWYEWLDRLSIVTDEPNSEQET